jgi:hypothetical protein
MILMKTVSAVSAPGIAIYLRALAVPHLARKHIEPPTFGL